MRFISLCLIVFILCSCSTTRKKEFTEDGRYIPSSPEIERTYSFPDVGSGYVYDAKHNEFGPTIQIELLDKDLPYVRAMTLEVGASQNTGMIVLNKRWTSIWEVKSGLWYGWQFKDHEPAFGVSFTISK